MGKKGFENMLIQDIENPEEDDKVEDAEVVD